MCNFVSLLLEISRICFSSHFCFLVFSFFFCLVLMQSSSPCTDESIQSSLLTSSVPLTFLDTVTVHKYLSQDGSLLSARVTSGQPGI